MTAPEARVDWEKVDEKIDAAVEFYFEDCCCEEGKCCKSCALKIELSNLMKSVYAEAYKKGREDA